MIYVIQSNTIVIEILVTFILLIIIIPTYIVHTIHYAFTHSCVNGKLLFMIEL